MVNNTVGAFGNMKTAVNNCDGEKLVDSKNFQLISYDDWVQNVFPTLP